MKKVMFLFMLLFSMSIFASGFYPNLEKKEKVEVSQDVDFDIVDVVNILEVVDVGKNQLCDISDFDLKENFSDEILLSPEVVSQNLSKQFKERINKRLQENRELFTKQYKAKINSFHLQAYRIDGYVGW
jgi:predicted nucleotidyltransferase component of viral defense system